MMGGAVASGNLIAESIRVGVSLEAVPLRVKKVYRVEAGIEALGQPRVWTFIAFDVPDEAAASLAEALTHALEPGGGWYCDFRTAKETFVVFAGRTFRYRRGDAAGRAKPEAHARELGVPE